MNLWMEVIDFFLREEKSHVLHFWQTCDLNNLLSHALEKLRDELKDYKDGKETTNSNTL